MSSSIPINGLSGLSSLLSGASKGEAPILSRSSSQVLAGGASPLVALGAGGADLTRQGVNEAINIFVLVDDSGSMSSKVREVIAGQNALLAQLQKDSRSGDMAISQWRFGSQCGVIHPAAPLSSAQRFGSGPGEYDYRANGGCTRLMESWQDMVAAAVADHQYNEEVSPVPTPTTTICIVMTDGGETELSGAAKVKKAAELQKVASDLIMSERFVLAFVGIDPRHTPATPIQQSSFYAIAKEMGFEDGCIGIDADVTRAFLRISSSVSQVSSGSVAPGPSSTFFT